MKIHIIETNKNKKYPEPMYSITDEQNVKIPSKYIDSGKSYYNNFYYTDKNHALTKLSELVCKEV